jgi:hypothetical protein
VVLPRLLADRVGLTIGLSQVMARVSGREQSSLPGPSSGWGSSWG